jgi:hypothetical protein
MQYGRFHGASRHASVTIRSGLPLRAVPARRAGPAGFRPPAVARSGQRARGGEAPRIGPSTMVNDPVRLDPGRDAAAAAARAGVPASWRPALALTATLLLLGLPTLALLAFSLAPPMNHDAAAILHYAQRWIAGDRLYVDLFDINPPLIFALSAVPGTLAALIPISAIAAAQASILLLAAWSLSLCWRLAGRDLPPAAPRSWVLATLLPFLMLAFPVEMFGQREHLMLIAALPYLLLAERRGAGLAVPRRVAVTAALLAALGFALKPHFLLLPVLVEGQLLVALRPRAYARNPAPWVLGAVWLGYLAVIVTAFSTWLTVVLPFAVAVYSGLDASLARAAFGAYGLPPLIALLALSPAAFRRGASALARLTALAAWGAWLAAVLQGKGWPYHLLPAESLVLLLAGILCADRAARLLPAAARARAGPVLAAACLALGLAAAAATREAPGDRLAYDSGEVAAITRLFAREAPGQPVLVLSAALSPWFPALNYAGSSMAARFMTMWVIQGSYTTCPPGAPRYRHAGDMPRAEQFAFDAIAADFAASRPALVVIDSLSGIEPCDGRSFDLLDYAMRHPLFAEAFSDYEEIAPPLGRLRVFRRGGAPPGLSAPLEGDP